ncbi:MAG: tyrosine-type recombinase/integrase [Bacteroidia bacterium]|nr:tyrosine-type recombinase/integrase [Bacteroidia bacterium]
MYTSNFLQYLQFEKRYSKHTVQSYKTDLDQFYSFLSTTYNLESVQQVTHSIIRSWIVKLLEQNISPRSINRKMATLKSYFKFLIREDMVKKNPMIKVVSLKNAKKLPEFVDQESIHTLFDQIEFEDSFEGLRDKLVLELLYATGIRRAEIIGLTNLSVDEKNCTIKVLGKRNKERLIPYNSPLNDLIKIYIENRDNSIEVNTTDANSPLLVTNKGKTLYPKLVYRIVNKYLSLITTLSKRSPHILRHTFATHLLNNGADINAIKELLGHANLAATQVYTHNTIDKLKDVYKQAHPRAT